MENSSTQPTDKFQTKNIASIVFGHFIHDVYSAFLSPLLPIIKETLGLTLFQSSMLPAISSLPSILNPFVGYLDDKLQLRQLVIWAPAFTATFISLIGLAPNFLALLILLLLTGFSIAAFHAPAPPMIARSAGNKVGLGMSLFMAGGELARTLGPIIAIWAVSFIGFENLYQITFIGWASSIFLFFRFRSIASTGNKRLSLKNFFPDAKRLFIPLTILILSSSFLNASLSSFLPLYMYEQGNSLMTSGVALAIFEFAGVGGAMLSGSLSDRMGRVPILFFSLLTSSILLIAFTFSPGWGVYPLLIAVGFISLSTQPVMLALVQDHMEKYRSVANGAFLAISFLIKSIATISIGYFGDLYTLKTAFLISGIIALCLSPIAFTLPRKKVLELLPE